MSRKVVNLATSISLNRVRQFLLSFHHLGAADALPKEWYTCLFVSSQMLLSFMYFTSVLGTTLRKRKIPEIKRYPIPKELKDINLFPRTR